MDAMTSTVNSLECDYLNSYTLPIPHAFPNEQAQFAHINEQISSLDNHISQLTTLRQALHHRSCQLHNLLARIHALPIEVWSYIFQQVIDSENYNNLDFYNSPRQLRGAFRLASVSAHFRHVALGTPELWKRITVCMSYRKRNAVSEASFLLQHCVALAVNVNVSVLDELCRTDSHSAIDILLTPDTMKKIKAFRISRSCTANLWVEKLTDSYSPVLETLDIDDINDLNIGTLKTMTRLIIFGRCQGRILLPPSVRCLHVAHVSERELVSLLYQCPNLVECTANVHHYASDDSDDNAQFKKPLILNHLKWLTFGAFDVIATPLSAQNFRLPSLEFLRVIHPREGTLIEVISFCCNLSATLTTLIMDVMNIQKIDSDDLYRLCKLPFPKLRKLEFQCYYIGSFQTIIHVLGRLDGECCNREDCHLPALESITLRCGGGEVVPRSLLDALKEWRCGEAFYFHLLFNSLRHHYRQWTPKLLDELRPSVDNRKIEVTWGGCRVQELCVQDGSL